MNDISIHNQFLEAAFLAMREAEDDFASTKIELEKATTLLTHAKNGAEKRLADAWDVIEKMLAESGEYEVLLPEHNAKICWSTPRQSVKIVDVEAVPDDFCKIERKPKLKEIGDLLKAGATNNWASLEYGEKHLQWRAVKPQAKDKEDAE